jgi:amino acid transporter
VSFQEKSAWAMSAIMLTVYGWYFVVLFGRLSDQDVAEIAYRGMLLATVLALGFLAVVSHIVLAVVNPKDAETADARDREINRFGEYVGGYVLGAAAFFGLVMAVLETDHFWIANVILAGMVLSELVSLGTRLLLYRRGI